jgi:hypothetical protein
MMFERLDTLGHGIFRLMLTGLGYRSSSSPYPLRFEVGCFG